ncbi:MAG: M56 family metallopeptidase [Oscillospiraceae bacterium]
MTDIFRTVLNMSITGAYIAAAIIILRIAMKKLPKKYSYLLWAILGIRLLCPISFSSAVSVFNVLVPEKPEVSYGQMEFIPNDIEYSEEPQITVSVPPVNDSINEQLPPAQPNNSANPMQIAMAVGAYIWAAGMLAMLVYTVVSYISVKKKVKNAALSDGNVYTCINIETPFVFGIIKPRIYLPENISEEDRTYIIAHEQAHISRKDHIVKLVAMAALCVHWFNPMVWVSYRLMTKDMELSCDEKALGTFDADVKKAYANALLNISLKQNRLALGGVLNFGESDIKSRVKGVLGAKKPKVIVTIIAVIAVIIAAVCLLTNAVKKDKEFAPIPDGVYVTDKLLYTAPQKDSYWGDDNGLTYEIKGDTLTISGKTYKLSEPMEIPFTEEKWSEAFDNFEKIGWQDGEKNLGDYENKYCVALQSDEDGGIENYLFVMDGEIWYVQYGWEIYRLKQIDTSPMDAARKYLNGKNITDENISELTVAQYSFYNEAWKYTLPPLSLKHNVNDGDNVIEVTAVYAIDGKEVRTLIITCANEEGFRVLDEVNYLPREFTAVISEVYGNEQLTGYEWQKYVIIPDEDSYGFTKGKKTLVFSRPYYGNDFFNVGDKVKVQYSGEPVASFTFVGFEQPAYYFLHLTSLQDGQPTEDIPEDVSDDDVKDEPAYSLPVNEVPPLQNSDEFESEDFGDFKKVSYKTEEFIPVENGGFSFSADRKLLNIEFSVPSDWMYKDGDFENQNWFVMGQQVAYPDSYGIVTDDFKVDQVSGREVNIVDERYGGDNDPWSYYIHTIMADSYYGDFDYHHFVVHSGGYYVEFSFKESEDFSFSAAEEILKTVKISPLHTVIDISSMQNCSVRMPIGAGSADTSNAGGAADVSFALPSEWSMRSYAAFYFDKLIFRVDGVYDADEDKDYSALNSGDAVEVIDETYAVDSKTIGFDYMVHKNFYGEMYEYVITRGDLSAIVRFNADESLTEEVRNAIIESIKIERSPIEAISEADLSNIEFSVAYNSSNTTATLSVMNNSNREITVIDDGIFILEDGEYTAAKFMASGDEITDEMLIFSGEGIEYYRNMSLMAYPSFKSGKYRAAVKIYFSDAPEKQAFLYAEFETCK